MAKRNKATSRQKDLFNIQEQLKTAPCVPAIREAAKAWRTGGYRGNRCTTTSKL
jgi:hypothetical protein